MSRFENRAVELKAALAAAIGSISVGFVPMLVAGLQRAGVDTVSVLVWRYIVALAVLVPLALWQHRLVDEWRRGGRWLVLNSLTLGTFQVLCYFKAIETLPTSVVVTVFYCYPVLALVLDRFVFAMPVTIAMLAAVAVIIGGVAMTSLPGFAGATLDTTGLIWAALSPVGYAVYIAVAYPHTRRVPPLASAVFIYSSLSVAFGAAAVASGFSVPPRPELWLNVLFIGTLGGAVQILSFSYALPRLGSSGYAIIVCLEVVTVVLAGVALLGERLLLVQVLGIALVLGGIVIAAVARRTPSRAAVPAPVAQHPAS